MSQSAYKQYLLCLRPHNADRNIKRHLAGTCESVCKWLSDNFCLSSQTFRWTVWSLCARIIFVLWSWFVHMRGSASACLCDQLVSQLDTGNRCLFGNTRLQGTVCAVEVSQQVVGTHTHPHTDSHTFPAKSTLK